jgi:TolB-like protein
MRPIALVVLVFPSLAWALPAVAVMPFKDLSGGKTAVGEAIRETVTTDLKDVPGLRVIERGNIDKILAEQNLQANKAELDPASTVKVGKLLGASLIVTGAYQRAAASVRLTARFVKVETSEITGTAKVDGPASDFLSLQDRVTVELLKSAGIEAKSVQTFQTRARPKLKSWKTVELYGDAVVEPDDGKRKTILLAALNEDPSFVYASRDLDALERRLAHYDATAKQEADRAIVALHEAIKNEKDPTVVTTKYLQMFSQMLVQRRCRHLIIEARAVLASPPPPAPPPYPSLPEMALQHIVVCESMLKDDDAVLRDGEKFVATYPSSTLFLSVRNSMDQSIERKRQREDGRAKAEADIAKLSSTESQDLCKVGLAYNANHQTRQARRLIDQCLAGGKTIMPRAPMLTVLVVAAMDEGDFAAARRYLEQMRNEAPDQYRSLKGFELAMPSD